MRFCGDSVIGRAFAVGVFLIPLFGACGCTHYKVVKDGEVNPPALRRVEKRTSAVRGLPFKEPVEAEVYTKTQSGEFFQREVSDEDKERARREDLVAHRLGMLPDGVSLADLFQKALTQNAAGVYQPGKPQAPTEPGETKPTKSRGRLFIVQDALPAPVRAAVGGFGYVTGTDWANELFLSHELMHALQDQHFDLSRVLPRGLYGLNEDMAIARKSVVESEANLVSQAYLLGIDLDSLVQRNALIEYLAFGRFIDIWTTRLMNPDLPPFYAKVLVEQYTQGMRFLQYVTNRGGWGAVNRAYATSLPQSTEQLMDPDKLFGDEPDLPKQLKRLDPKALPPSLAEWTWIDGNVLGALLWRIYLEDYASGVSDLVEGWGGDRYDVLERDGRSLLCWRTVWDTEEDALEFADGYGEVLQGKYPGRVTARDHEGSAGGGSMRVFDIAKKEAGTEEPGVRTLDDEVAVVVVETDKVLILEGSTEDTFRAMTKELMEQIVVLDGEEARVVFPEPSEDALAAATLDFVRETPPPLKERVVMPHHRMVFRLGLGASFDHASDPGSVRLGPQLDREFRWGFRQRLEWTPPYLLTVTLLDSDVMQTAVTSGLADLNLSFGNNGLVLTGQPLLTVTQAFHLGRYFAIVGQMGMEADLTTDMLIPPRFSVVGAAALYGAISDRVIGAAGVSYRSAIELQHVLGPPRLVDPTLVLGAATNRARPTMPTLEIRIYDGFHLYEASQVFFDPVQLKFLGHRHVAGVMLYF